jgi:transposase-like protein
MECPYCKGARLNKAGKGRRQGQSVQRYWCIDCNRRFSDRAGTPMHRIHKSVEQVERVLKMRSEGLGVRASGRVETISPATVILWEKRLASKVKDWSPPAPAGCDITIEGDEVYTKVEKNHPSHKVLAGRSI